MRPKALISRIKGVQKFIDKRLAYERKMAGQPGFRARIVETENGKYEVWEKALKDYANGVLEESVDDPKVLTKYVGMTTYLKHPVLANNGTKVR